MGLWAVEWAEPLVTKDKKVVRELSATFTVLFTGKTGLHLPYIPETLVRVGARETYPW